MEIIASPHVEFFTISWRSRGILPSSKIKRAWFRRIQAGGPADKAGIKVGDELLMLGGIDVAAMSGTDMKMSHSGRAYTEPGKRSCIVTRKEP